MTTDTPQGTPPAADGTRRVQISTSVTATRVVVEGRDIAPLLASATLHLAAHQTPVLHLEAIPQHLDYEGPALVEVADPRPVAPRVQAWLAALDPAEVERRALDSAGMSRSVTSAVLDVLTDLATDLDTPGGP